MSSAHAAPGSGLAEEIREFTGINAACCYQCGKCSAGCPMAPETKLRPHDLMRLVARGERDRVFGDDAIWLCLTCETCSARCPNDCDPARVIDALREIAAAERFAVAPRAIRALHRSFLDQIRWNGRVHEIGLVVEYKARTGSLLADAATTPGLMLRGKLPLAPARIDGVAEVRRIFRACLAGEDEK
jgi:heterodisulfide reductase subunit C